MNTEVNISTISRTKLFHAFVSGIAKELKPMTRIRLKERAYVWYGLAQVYVLSTYIFALFSSTSSSFFAAYLYFCAMYSL